MHRYRIVRMIIRDIPSEMYSIEGVFSYGGARKLLHLSFKEDAGKLLMHQHFSVKCDERHRIVSVKVADLEMQQHITADPLAVVQYLHIFLQ